MSDKNPEAKGHAMSNNEKTIASLERVIQRCKAYVCSKKDRADYLQTEQDCIDLRYFMVCAETQGSKPSIEELTAQNKLLAEAVKKLSAAMETYAAFDQPAYLAMSETAPAIQLAAQITGDENAG